MVPDDDTAGFEDWDWVTMASGSIGHQVADANFAVGDRKFIGYPTDANDVSR
jgi:hypothetical protein